MRVLFFSERLAPPFDEGIKNVARHLLRCLKREHEVLALTSGGADMAEPAVRELSGLSRLLTDASLRRMVRAFRPERIIYLPTASMTLAAFVRLAVLRRHGRGAPTTLIALQPRHQGTLSRLVVPLLAPERAIVQSRASAERLAYLGRRVHFVPAGVDISCFAPAAEPARTELRRRYGLPLDRAVVLHAGHINRNRNVQIMGDMQRRLSVQMLLAGSTSTPQDGALTEELRRAGVRVLTEYQPQIEELFRLADLYVFPCPADTDPARTPAIEVPLSVLEALACDLPVVTTRFGGLPALLPAGAGVLYVEQAGDAAEWTEQVRRGLAAGRGHTRGLAGAFSWERLAAVALGQVEE